MQLKIGNKPIGDGHPVFIIAEMSANHCRDITIAKEIIRKAKEAGADAVKIQTYTPDTMTIDCDTDLFTLGTETLWAGKTLYSLYSEAYTPWEWHSELKRIADELNIIFFSTPFDRTAVDFLENLDVPVYKIASFEITDIPLIEYVASKQKPVIISTGIASICDIQEAIDACARMGNMQVILLKCTSTYPAPVENTNLKTIPHLSTTFHVISGLSDHTQGIVIPLGAVATGAQVIEKHFMLDEQLGGPDAAFSLNPEDFSRMVQGIRDLEAALGTISYACTREVNQSRALSRSIFVTHDIRAGEQFSQDNVRVIRPGYGLHPRYFHKILKKNARTEIKRGTPLSWDLIEG